MWVYGKEVVAIHPDDTQFAGTRGDADEARFAVMLNQKFGSQLILTHQLITTRLQNQNFRVGRVAFNLLAKPVDMGF